MYVTKHTYIQIRVRTQEPCRYARPQLGEHHQNQLRRRFAMYSFNKNPNAFAMWKWERETTRNSQPKCSLCSDPPKLLSCTVPKPSHLVVVNSRAALPSALVLPALLYSLAHTLGILSAVVLVQVRRFDVGRRRCVGVVQQTASCQLTKTPSRRCP